MDDKLCDILINPVYGPDLSQDEGVVVTGSCCAPPRLVYQDWTPAIILYVAICVC